MSRRQGLVFYHLVTCIVCFNLSSKIRDCCTLVKSTVIKNKKEYVAVAVYSGPTSMGHTIEVKSVTSSIVEAAHVVTSPMAFTYEINRQDIKSQNDPWSKIGPSV